MRYCAFLRGVNVKGTTMKMADVVRVFEETGMTHVASVLASGNILFESEQQAAPLKILLEKKLSAAFNYEAFLFIRNCSEIQEMVSNCPFESNENFHTYIFVTENGVAGQLVTLFKDSEKSDGERAAAVGETLYWQVPKGSTLSSDFGKILGKKSFKNRLTSRNINTFEKILVKLNS